MKKVVLLFATVLFLGTLFSSTYAFADTNEDSHAAVIIDTGQGAPKTACITFRGDTISGAQALELANAQPVYQSFAGTGRAVCALCGVGCPAGDTCLTCAGSTFWNYFHAKSGATSFTLSGVGASSSEVRDGDVEGWRFGVGQKPAFLSYNTICGITIDSGASVSQAETVPQAPAPKTRQKQVSSSALSPTSTVPSKVLGKTLVRKNIAQQNAEKPKKLSHRSNRSNIVSMALILVGASAAGYFLYRSRRKNATS